MKKTVIAAVSAAFLMGTASVASAQICAVGVIAAAIYASAKENRELTAKEAWSCGILLGHDDEAKAKPAKKKSARKTKSG